MLSQLIGRGRISREVLGLLTSTPEQELHTREIARRVKADAHPVQRALEQLLSAGVVESRRLGNLRLWSVARGGTLLPALRDLVRHTTGPAERLRRTLSGLPGVQLAFLFGSYASGRDKPESDIDLFLVGSIEWRRLSKELAELSSELGRELNPVIWSVDELAASTPTQTRFIRNLLSKPRIWLMGDDDELERIRSSVGATMVRGTTPPTGASRRRSRSLATGARGAQHRARKT